MPAPARLPRTGRAARRWLATCTAAAAVLGMAPSAVSAQEEPAADAMATQAAPETASSAALPDTLSVAGHGWGHGRGMGQFGSLGYATGWSAVRGTTPRSSTTSTEARASVTSATR